MPFNTNKELASRVPGTEKLTEEKKTQFRKIWNECFAQGKPEETCYKIAWGVVKKASCDGGVLGIQETEGTLSDAYRTKELLSGCIREAIRGLRKR